MARKKALPREEPFFLRYFPKKNKTLKTEIGKGYDKGLRGPYDPAPGDFISWTSVGE